MEKITKALQALYDYCEKLNLNDANLRRKLYSYCTRIESELSSGWKHADLLETGEKVIIQSTYTGMIASLQNISQAILSTDAESNKSFSILVQLLLVIKAATGLKSKLVKMKERIDLEDSELKKMLDEMS